MIDNAISLAKILESYKTIVECAEELGQEDLASAAKSIFPQVLEQFNIEFEKLLFNANIQLERRSSLRGDERLKLFQDHGMNEYELGVYRTILSKLVSWQFPVLDMFPGAGDMLPYVVGGEPLYTVDWDTKILDHVGLQFNEFFAERRLIRYKIKEYELTMFKPNTFGVVYNLHWSKFEKLDNLVTMAENAHKVLLPGGHYFFKYNPTETIWGLTEFAANNSFGAITQQLLEKLTGIGYEILNNSVSEKASFVLCKKAGELSSPKASAILAKIID